MNKKTAKLFLTGILLTIASSGAYAFDGERKGFQIGLGLGAHLSDITYTEGFAPTDTDKEPHFALSGTVGYGFSNRIVGHFGFRAGSFLVDDKNASLAIAGVGGSLYLADSYPALYVTGLVGGGSLSLDDENEDDVAEGPGWLAGIGYEITHRLHLELSHARAELVNNNNSDNKTTVQTSYVTLQYLWY